MDDTFLARAELARRAEEVLREVVQRRHVSASEVETVLAEARREQTAEGWLTAWGRGQRMLERELTAHYGGAGGAMLNGTEDEAAAQLTPEQRLEREAREAVAAAAADGITLAALAGRAEVIELPGDEQEDGTLGPRRRVRVYPKGFEALAELHWRDLVLGDLADTVLQLGAIHDAAELPLLKARAAADLAKVLDEILHQHRLCCWIATDAGKHLPWGMGDVPTELPPHLADFDTLDFLLVMEGSQRVNLWRLKALRALIAKDTLALGEESPTMLRASWSVFFGALAPEMHTSPAVLMRDRTLGELLATTRLAAAQRRAAMEQARRDAAAAQSSAAA